MFAEQVRGIAGDTPRAEGNKRFFRRPFLLLHGDTYFAYGTYAGDGIAVYVSQDLLRWEAVPGRRLALDKTDSWGNRWFWAPEVYHMDGRFYMYYSADEHICVATSDSPLGPFKQEVQQPMIPGEKCIDNSLFIEDDGQPYLLYDRFNGGLNIWVAELKDNLTEITPETAVKCINVSQAWEEVWPRVNEGPFVWKHDGKYYMTYSANSYESPSYGIGFATAEQITGPWTKYEGNPILQKPGNLVGVGHRAMFWDKAGKLRVVFHAHHSETEIHPRIMHISTVDFVEKDGKTIMQIDADYVTPVLLQ